MYLPKSFKPSAVKFCPSALSSFPQLPFSTLSIFKSGKSGGSGMSSKSCSRYSEGSVPLRDVNGGGLSSAHLRFLEVPPLPGESGLEDFGELCFLVGVSLP